MAGPSPEGSGYSERLCQAERDLELAAQIGQSLLEQNRELQTRNEFLEENLASSAETIVQLNHELHKRIELLRVYSYYDDDDAMGNDDTSLRQRIDKLLSENRRLRNETNTLQKEVDGVDEKSRKQMTDLMKQVEAANEKIEGLQSAIQLKSEECTVQSQSIEKLLHEIALRHSKERKLLSINDEISKQLDDASDRQCSLLSEMQILQNDYLEMKSMFYEAEEELIKFRQQAPHRSRSFDSVYDSLASELENSDTGIISAPTSYRSVKPENFHLNLRDTCINNSNSVEVDVPSAVLMELSRKTFMIENDLPVVPLQTPQADISLSASLANAECRETQLSEVEKELDENTAFALKEEFDAAKSDRRNSVKNRVLCDASTSTDFPSTSDENQQQRSIRIEKQNILTGRGQVNIGLHLVSQPRKVQRSESIDSLDGYVAPKLGEPGVPGTRDLDFSLKVLKAKLQVEQDFAQYCRRKGLTLRSFCQSGSDNHMERRNNDDWVNYSVFYGNECQKQLASPLRTAVSSNFLTSSEGVVTRNALSPGNMQQLTSIPSTDANGLAGITGGSIFSSGGILKRL